MSSVFYYLMKIQETRFCIIEAYNVITYIEVTVISHLKVNTKSKMLFVFMLSEYIVITIRWGILSFYFLLTKWSL